MRRWLTIALGGLVLSCQGPAAVMAREAEGAVAALVIPDAAQRRSGTEAPPVWTSRKSPSIVRETGDRRALT